MKISLILFIQSAILLSITSYTIDMYIFCDDLCNKFYINDNRLNISDTVQNKTHNKKLEANLGDKLSIDVKDFQDGGGICLNFTIGELTYSTNLTTQWKLNLGNFSNKKNINKCEELLYLYKEGSGKKFVNYLFSFKIPEYVKLKDFEVKSTEEKFSFFLDKEIVKNILDVKGTLYASFTKTPKYGVINHKADANNKISSDKDKCDLEKSREFEYVIDDAKVKNLNDYPIKDSITFNIRNGSGIMSNEAKINFIYCPFKNYSICSQGYLDPCTRECVNTCESDMVLYYKICHTECPENYLSYDGVCIEEKIISNGTFGISYVDQSITELIDNLDDTFKIYKKLNAKLSGSNFFFEIISSSDSNKKRKDASSVNLCECEEILKEKYKISEVFIAKIDIKTSNPIDQLEYMAFDSNGKRLDLNYCKGQKILIDIPLKDEYREKVSKFSKEGIDILDVESPFFNDICFPYQEGEKGDVILKDRRETFNLSINVEEGCSYALSKEGKVRYECEVKTEVSSLERPSYTPTFQNELLYSTNLFLVVCYKTLTLENLSKTNYGLWVCASIFCIETTLFINFSCCGYKKFLSKLLNSVDSANPTSKPEPFETPSGKEIQLENHSVKNEFTSSSEKRKEEIANSLRNNSFNESLNNKNPFKIFCTLLLSKIELYTIIFTPGSFDIVSLSLAVFILSFLLDFGFNAFFFSDDVISNKFKNEGNIRTSTKILLPFLSNVFGSFFQFLIEKLGNVIGFFDLIEEQKYGKDKFLKVCNRSIKIIRCKIFFYYLLQFVLLAFMSYYLTIFCIVYPGSQYNWFIDCLTGIALSTLTLILCCMIISIIRAFSLYMNLNYLYYGTVYLEKFA